MKKIFFFLIIVGAAWELYNYSGQVSLGPGVMVSELPQQESIDSPVSYSIDDYSITETAKFSIRAKVLSRKNYHIGREADLSPIDLALGWGNMSDEVVLEKIKISQSRRFYRWHVESFPIPRREIETHSANMHIIPANDKVKSVIDRVRKGDIIEISGSLVNVMSNTDDWHWSSSLTRNDTGKGACELIWVESLDIVTL
ncbi:hypothetical protein CJF42_18725 [Pseudoalteromonas sp. NBT06-2]|uniref:hypothetical protein n=1 Tax=Pseudoalteromonas sp. NBT06-2 TaxID=2025950 RepID=UPI000BA7DAB9|nr:hypothetical protein [Pseudoalteromonas sp. NBT06-2]PAJ72926.1 hypothetical protein CJF42_18725 [Pseudoalteromonas sp. NBT06-2]